MAEPVAVTERQLEILRNVVEEFVATGQPVGSKTLVLRGGIAASPSTVRAELAELEARGLLTHPHTSAGRLPAALEARGRLPHPHPPGGRIPPDRGYRVYVDALLGRLEPRPASGALALR